MIISHKRLTKSDVKQVGPALSPQTPSGRHLDPSPLPSSQQETNTETRTRSVAFIFSGQPPSTQQGNVLDLSPELPPIIHESTIEGLEKSHDKKRVDISSSRGELSSSIAIPQDESYIYQILTKAYYNINIIYRRSNIIENLEAYLEELTTLIQTNSTINKTLMSKLLILQQYVKDIIKEANHIFTSTINIHDLLIKIKDIHGNE